MANEKLSGSAEKIGLGGYVADSQDPEAVSYDDSEELRQSNSLALEENTRAEGLKRLSEIIKKYPDSSDPYGLLAQALIKTNKVGEAEGLLLEAYPKVLKKSKIAGSLGSHYLFQKKDLLKAIEWYVKSVAAAGSSPTAWSPYLYLSGIYKSFGFFDIASELQGIANLVRGNPVDLTTAWHRDLESMKVQASADTVRSLLKEDFERAISPAIKAFQEKGKAPVEGSVYRPDLKCRLCGNANVVFSFNNHTQLK